MPKNNSSAKSSGSDRRFKMPGQGGRGRMGGFGLGPGGECVCSNCGNRIPHKRGIPCYNLRCPKCGSPMTRAR